MRAQLRRTALVILSSAVSVIAGTVVALPAAVATDTASAPAARELRTIDDVYHDIAREVPGFAGARFEPDGTTTVFLTQPSDTRTASAGAALRDVWPTFGARTRAVRVRYDFRQLKTWYDGFSRTALAHPDVVMTDIDEGHNRLYVGVSDTAAGPAVRALAEQHGVPADVLTVGHTEPQVPANLRTQHRPLVAGLQIAFSRGKCTMGFLVRLGGADGFLTNSHCTAVTGGGVGTPIGQPDTADGNQIGTETLDPPLFTDRACPAGRRCRWSDAAFIRTTVADTRGFMAVTPTGDPTSWNGTNHAEILDKRDHPPLGTTVTKTGRTTGTTHGTVRSTCVDLNAGGTDITYLCQGVAAMTIDFGDSGSALWEDSRGVASGLIWGLRGAFSPWGNLEHELGTPCPTADCSLFGHDSTPRYARTG